MQDGEEKQTSRFALPATTAKLLTHRLAETIGYSPIEKFYGRDVS
jgi:hypothetical protein